MQDLGISIIHYLPGRLRIRLFRPPRKIERIQSEILGHKGVCCVKFNPIARSILIYYNPTEIEVAEIIVRIGISLSVDYGMRPVNIFSSKQTIGFNNLDNYSLISVALAGVAKLLRVKGETLSLLNYNAGLSTLMAVIKHALSEMKLSGSPHPEVVSAVYLVNAILKKDMLLASIFTWMVTFGRHLVAAESDNITLQAFKVLKEDGHKNYYDVAIKDFNQSSDKNSIVRLFTDLTRYFIGMNSYQSSSMINKIKKVSKSHGDILEGLNSKDEMVFLRLIN